MFVAGDVRGDRGPTGSELETAVRAALVRMAANAPRGVVAPVGAVRPVGQRSARRTGPVAALALTVAAVVVAALVLVRPGSPGVAAPALPSCVAQADAWQVGAARAGVDEVMVPAAPVSSVVCNTGHPTPPTMQRLPRARWSFSGLARRVPVISPRPWPS